MEIEIARDTPLMLSIYLNKYENIEKELHNCVDINYRNTSGCTALHYACMFSNAKIVALLCEAGANPIIPDNKGNTPLHYAAKITDDYNMINILRYYGGSVNITNNKNVTPLMKACDHNTNNVVLSKLISLTNIDFINKQNKYGNTALHFLYFRNKTHLVPQIIQAGANTQIQNKLNQSYYTLSNSTRPK